MVPLIVANVYYRKHLCHNDISPHFQIIIIQKCVFLFFIKDQMMIIFTKGADIFWLWLYILHIWCKNK